MREINVLIVHHSATRYGDVETFRDWHVEKGWGDVGYHGVVLNGCRAPGSFDPNLDGVYEVGRPIRLVGTHDAGENADSFGLCLVALHLPTWRQLCTLHGVCQSLRATVNPRLTVEGHREDEPGAGTACPGERIGANLELMREWLDIPTPDPLHVFVTNVLAPVTPEEAAAWTT